MKQPQRVGDKNSEETTSKPELSAQRAELVAEQATRKNAVTGLIPLSHPLGQLAGPGRGSAAATGAGITAPTTRLLVDQAAELRPLPKEVTGGAWELHFPDDRTKLFLDPGDIVASIRVWIFCAFRAARDTQRPTSAPVLIITGLVKSGKSYCQGAVVLSLVAETMGASVMLHTLLLKLLKWVLEEGVPVRASALQAAKELAAQPIRHDNPAELGEEIASLLHAVEVPVLVLFDEVQSMFLPTLDGELDKPGSEYIRDCFMKYLLQHGPRTMLWCITGSSMALTWINIAKMPTNGFTLMTSASEIALPASSSPDHLSLVMEGLREAFLPQKVDPLLLELCPPSVALLTVLVNEWLDKGSPKDVQSFVRNFLTTKLMEESMKEWSLGLAAMPVVQRLAVLDLASVEVGMRIDNVNLHAGLRRFLMPYMDKTANGRWYLRDPYQRQLVRLMINKDGTLRNSWSEEEFSVSMVLQDCGWILLRLGETADSLLGPMAGKLWKGKKLPVGMLGFQKELQSEWNRRDLTRYSAEKKKLDSHLAMLVFYLRLSRNMLAQMKPWNRTDGTLLDVGVIEALPSVLDRPMVSFYGDAFRALRMLVPYTAKEAKARRTSAAEWKP
ncbi:hypothetical protein GPECTOR_730g889 [Gonium pectorale]|uniref:Uncharacterized protein n=1 Tax=Gonium pectorale TaxID=33097 RepID=A0A150FU47_GONPE|nr:hypothetical protein GPECTOR_730g889 [Gonium pectorale]|eukprot:KXZ41141.1 hypothetical protein GPECTOR_730g889 [Gonium pectorale]